MKKVNITLTFDDDKLDALEFSLRKEHSSVQARMDDALFLRPSPSARPNPLLRKRRIVNRSPRQPW